MIEISVIIPTYNPDVSRLNKTLNSLKEQTLSKEIWELIIIDNNSGSDFSARTDISWHPNSSFTRERRQGLTYARLKGFNTAKGKIVVMVDDDNLLYRDYLDKVVTIVKKHPEIGAFGGKSLPLFEAVPPIWLNDFYNCLALRDLGEEIIIECWERKYPYCAPIGAGMAIRKISLEKYIKKLEAGRSTITDRVGNSLMSGGDNDIVLEIIQDGWAVAYFPELVLQHIIPAGRMQVDYISRLVNNSSNSWVKLLRDHHISPWAQIPAWSVGIRKLKAWFIYKAWKSKANYIRWQGACGTFDGLAKS
jgi:glycosyltransferase involved in cell wall biosynthesis